MPTKLAKLSPLAVIVLGLLLADGLQGYETPQTSNDSHARLPRFEVDRSWQWPPKLPNNWVVGVVTWVAVGLHTIAVDSKGNLWTAETQPKPVGSRVQRLMFKGIS